jgi:hypothetical protein
MDIRIALIIALLSLVKTVSAEDRQLYWGDTHLHTSNSFDAFALGNQSMGVQDAYNFAKGIPVIHPASKSRVKIETPLDFLVIADHAEYLGVFRKVYEDGIPDDNLGVVDKIRKWYLEYRVRKAIDEDGIAGLVSGMMKNQGDPIEAARDTTLNLGFVPNTELMTRTAWAEYIKLADANNAPGTFTTLIGWEWSPIPGGANLHRVVFTDANAETASTFQPFHLGDSPYPEDLWNWLESISTETSSDFIAIPHNSNISKGFMFPEITIKGEPVTAEYARARAKWEPIAEITQIKGDSETISGLSPNDDFADFETYSHFIQAKVEDYVPSKGDYVRSGLKRGLEFSKSLGVNPFKMGVIGSTDSHTGLASAEEQNFHGKFARDGIPASKLKNPDAPDRASGWSFSAQGIAAVWADRNDREAIMAAFKRREVYGTSGPRIKLRFFGGWDFTKADLQKPDYVQEAYRKGVPMGGDLYTNDKNSPPTFLVHAFRDPKSANLDRIQIVKGWLDNTGQSQERVFDVSWSDNRVRGQDEKIPAIGSSVNSKNATYSNDRGANELSAIWTDETFDASQESFYYMRVLEIPTPRHALGDALALGMKTPDRGPIEIQERAYSSPIWYTP